jgi:hypothetical protein
MDEGRDEGEDGTPQEQIRSDGEWDGRRMLSTAVAK